MKSRIESNNNEIDKIIQFIYDNLEKHSEMLSAIETDDLKRFAEICATRFTDIDVLACTHFLSKMTGYERFCKLWKDNPYYPSQVLVEEGGKLKAVSAETYVAFENFCDTFHKELIPELKPKFAEQSLFLAAAKCKHAGFIRILAVDYAKKKSGITFPHSFFDLALEHVILQGKKDHFDLLVPQCQLGSFWCWVVWGGDVLQTRKLDLAKKVHELKWLDINQVTSDGSILHTMLALSTIVSQGIAETLGFFLDAGIDVTIKNAQGKTAFDIPNELGKYLLELAIAEVKQSMFSTYKPGNLISSVKQRNVSWLTQLLMSNGKPQNIDIDNLNLQYSASTLNK